MKKILTISLFAVFLTACTGGGEEVVWNKLKFGELEVKGEEYFVRYPEEALFYANSAGNVVEFENCKIQMGTNLDLPGREGLEAQVKDSDGLTYTAWYQENQLFYYDVLVEEADYVFAIGDGKKDISPCLSFIDYVAGSFSSQLGYVNEKYGFALDLPADFEAEYFPQDGGLALRKRISVELTEEEIEEGKKDSQYKVEILFLPFENTEGFANISEFIAEKYQGFTIEFADFGEYSGFFVGEGNGGESIQHFFVMLERGDAIFQAYLKVNSLYYNEHVDTFKNLMSELDFF